MKRIEWEAEARKAMFLKGYTVTELAAAVGMTREHTGKVLSGYVVSERGMLRISDILGIEPWKEDRDD